jgi:spore coat protein H
MKNRKKLFASLGLCVSALMFVAATLPCAGKSEKKEAAELFETNRIIALQIQVSEAGLKALQKENRKFVGATVTEGTNVWRDVAIHLKGSAGSLRGMEDKPALTLSFGKFTPDQRFHGLKKIHLNNSIQDNSYMTENICGEMFRKAGVPAARATYASVELNGRKKGLYVLKEGFTKDLLSAWFKSSKGNLYDGGFVREITEPLERDQGEEDDVSDRADLKALAAAAQEPDPTKRFRALTNLLDVDRFLAFVIVEVITWDWDGYVLKPNNYRVYHDPKTKRMTFMPTGMDQMFWIADAPMMPKMQGLVARAFVKTPEGRALYYKRFGELYTNVFDVALLTNRVAELGALIRPALTNLHGPNAGKDYDGQIKRLHDLIVGRHASLARQIAAPLPTPLKFENGIVKLTGWEIPSNVTEEGSPKRDRPVLNDKKTLHIETASKTSASWRTTVMLDAGHYRFEGLARTAGVVASDDPQKGGGAGVRISGSQTPRSNKLVGDTEWKTIAYEFDADMNDEVILVCELRASKGEVWFDTDSMKLTKVK